MRIQIVVTVALLHVTAAFAETKEAYICFEEKVIGFDSDKRMEVVTFTSNKFTMVKLDNSITVRYAGDLSSLDCKTMYGTVSPNLISCSSGSTYFTFDMNTLKFARGKLFPTREDDLVLSFGSCQKF